MGQKSLFKNSIYNFIYTGLNIIFPLITTPYVARVLGASELGKVNFANSITTWFLIFATYGTTIYGIREVAQNRDNKNKLDKIFSEIFLINLIMSILAIAVLLGVAFITPTLSVEFLLYVVMAVRIFVTVFSIEWFYQGIEEYRYITIRNTIVKVISLILIFLLVDSPDDYILYALITVIGIGVGGLLNYMYSRQFVTIIWKNLEFKTHLKKLHYFFSSDFVVNIYTSLDQTLLGIFSTTTSVAFMSQGKMVIGAANTVANAISNATLPRASYYARNNSKQFNELQNLIPKIILWISIPIVCGIFVLAEDIVLILGGKEFLPAASVLMILAPTVVFSSLSSFFQRQVLVSRGLEKQGFKASVISSMISIISNVILIQAFGVNGAALASLISEFSAFFIRVLIARHFSINLKILNKDLLMFLVSGVVMVCILLILRNILATGILLRIVLSVVIGCIVYISSLLLVKDPITKMILNKVLKLIERV